MKLFYSTFILLLFSLLTQAANPPVKKDTIPFSIKRINFDPSYRADTALIDTSILKLNVFTSFDSQFPSFSFLSRNGYPLISNCYTNRLEYSDIFVPANSFLPIIQDTRYNYFYLTTKPFTSFTYKNAGQTSNTQDYLQILHTQNISKRSNFGLFYNNYYSFSQYDLQKAGDHSATIFYRYSGNKYFAYGQFYINSFSIKESGGITNDTLVDYTSANNAGLTENLTNANTKFKRYGFSTTHEYKFRTFFRDEFDSTNYILRDYGSIIYNFNIETSKRKYSDDGATTFYNKNYFSSENTNDSVVFDRISNSLLLSSPYIWKYLPNLRASLNNDIYLKTIGIPDTINISPNEKLINLKHDEKYFNTWIGADISQRLSYIFWNISGKLYTLGYAIGDESLSATARMYADKANTISLTLKATEETKTPSFYYNRYYSNHFIWNNSTFNREKKIAFSAIASTIKPQLSASFDYILLSDYVYFNEKALPAQATANLQMIVLGFKSRLELWKFSTENNFVLQTANTDLYIHVPKILFYNSTEFTHTIKFFTGGHLYTKLGVDLYYTSTYYLNSYMPSSGVFYLQNAIMSQDYPRVDFHLTCKVKSLSFFIKYIHANAGYNGKQYFNATHYPMLPAVFSYGINWLFYD